MRKVSGQGLNSSEAEDLVHTELQKLLAERTTSSGPLWNTDLITYTTRMTSSRFLYLNELYLKILDVPGVILEFGVRYGTSMVAITNLRGIHEPFNYQRKIIGFDTFEGFPSVHQNDTDVWLPGDYDTPLGYEDTLEKILNLHEQLSPVSHIKKYEIVKGDVLVTINQWLDSNPGLMVAMAMFDMDLYEPTKHALAAIQPRLMRGSMLVFDEFSNSSYPGETLAVREQFDTREVEFGHSRYQPSCAWLEVK
jgi:hypothetical protein